MSNIPCKNCITFAICNAQISDDKPFEDVVYKLIPKCSLVKDYTKYDKYYFSEGVIYFPSESLLKVATFFKPTAPFITIAKFFKTKESFINYAKSKECIHEVNKGYTL